MVQGTEGCPPYAGVTGTLVYIQVIWHYVEIFISGKASLMERVTYAGLVTHFLAIWRNHIIVTRNLTLAANFLSRETYTNVLLSTYAAVSLITYMRDQYPAARCHLDLTGADVVEMYWSAKGQWVGHRHNYDFARLQRNLTHMIRLEEIRTDPHAPKFARPHPKGEVIWPKQYNDGWVPAYL